MPDRPASSPAHVEATSLPRADTAPMPVTTTRRTPFEPFRAVTPRLRSSDELARADGGRAVDIARQAAGRDGVRGREDVVLGALDLGGDRPIVERHERPRGCRVAIEDVARGAAVDDDLPAELADLGDVGVAAADDAGIRPGQPFERRRGVEALVE